ncbi:MAG: hypothetical protein KC729_05760, partial [Candidatus Eisenbacteria bacterium]|nr:hypothetical protein [Candidatus Eisenbacteria bacterium]
MFLRPVFSRCLVSLCVVVAAGLLASPLAAAERVVHQLDERNGLSVAETSLLAQDSRGFLWVGTIGGLYRFDGAEVRPWAPDQIRHVVKVLATGPSGEVVVAGEDEPLWSVGPAGVDPVSGPHGTPIRSWIDAVWSFDGALWVASTDTLWRRPSGEPWEASTTDAFGGSPLYHLYASRGDSIFVAPPDALWAAHRDGTMRFLGAIPFVGAVHALDERVTVALGRNTGIWRLDGEGDRLMRPLPEGSSDLAVREGTIWVTQGRQLYAITPDGTTRTITPREGIPPGRALLVDREGTLWIAGLRGLLGLPEPETVAWNALDGLPDPPHAHHVARSADAVWVVTWFGSVRLERSDGNERIVPIGTHSGRIRPDPAGRMWAADLDAGFLRWSLRDSASSRSGIDSTRFARPGVHGLYGTSARPDGTMWMTTDDGIFLAPVDDTAPRFCDAPIPGGWETGWEDCWLGPCLEDPGGTLWIGHGEEVIACDADSLA